MVMDYSKRTYMKRQITPQHKGPQPIVTVGGRKRVSSRCFLLCCGCRGKESTGATKDDGRRKKKNTYRVSVQKAL